MKLDYLDATIVALFLVALLLTVLLFLAVEGPAVAVRDSTPALQATVIPGNKPQIKMSEARPFIERYVEEISRDDEERGLGVMSQEKKRKLVESVIDLLKARYDFVE